jgi:hypothetical protein
MSDPPTMYFLLKKQTALLPPTESIGILLTLFTELKDICEITTILPYIEPSREFKFGNLVNNYIKSGEASILMLVNYETKKPCAALVFTYIPDNNYLYIDFLAGDKKNKQCGGGPTYLLWHFCKCVDRITSPNNTIPIQLVDAATNRKYYDNLFGNIDDTDHRVRTSMTRKRSAMPAALKIQSSVLHSTVPSSTVKMIRIERGLDRVSNLRNYNIVYEWRVFTGEVATIKGCKRIALRLLGLEDENKLIILNDLLINACKINNYSSAIRYLENAFSPNDRRKIIYYITETYPPDRHMWANAFLQRIAGKNRIKTKKRKGRANLTRSKK